VKPIRERRSHADVFLRRHLNAAEAVRVYGRAVHATAAKPLRTEEARKMIRRA
jgi:hypothetical protein